MKPGNIYSVFIVNSTLVEIELAVLFNPANLVVSTDPAMQELAQITSIICAFTKMKAKLCLLNTVQHRLTFSCTSCFQCERLRRAAIS